VKDTLRGPIKTGAALVIGGKETGKAYSGLFDDLRLYSRALGAREVKYLAVNRPIRAVLSGAHGQRSKEEGD